MTVVNYGTDSIGILLGYGNGSFHDYQTYSTGYDSFPTSLVVGDFNGNSHVDIVVVNSGTDNIGIFLGIGNGSFANQLIYSILLGSNPSSISAGDFNNDKHLDIVISNNSTQTIEILFGYGNGTFQQQQHQQINSFALNSYVEYVNVGDVNGDHHLDIIAIDSINDQIHIIQGFGNGSFYLLTTYDGISQSDSLSIALADFNKNNQTDLVVANSGINNILVLIDYFVEAAVRQKILFSDISPQIDTYAVGDFNNDHILDIVYNSQQQIYIMLGLGNGHFIQSANYSKNPKSIWQYTCIGDVNNDNQTDIIAADIVINSVNILLGHGNGTFSQIENYSTGDNSQPYSIAIGDFNRDNAVDIVTVNPGSISVSILLRNKNQSFHPAIIYFIPNDFPPYAVAIGYIDNDNYLDFAVCGDGNMITIFLGLGNGSFYIDSMFNAGGNLYLHSIALADFNNDNHLDIVVADTQRYRIVIFSGNGNGTFDLTQSYDTGLNSLPYHTIVNDFNNDHIDDITVCNFGSNEILIFYGYGNGTFQLARNYSTGDGSKPFIMTDVDLDNDKQLDIVVRFRGSKKLAVLTEYHAAQFQIIRTLTTGSAPQPTSVAVAKFNNNRSSIIVANSGNDSLRILNMSNNDIFDQEISSYSTDKNSEAQYVITCDINNDQQLDIISANSKADNISVFLGRHDGTFENQITYSTGIGSHPVAIVASDLNNDTRLDLVIANEGNDNIGIFYGFNYTTFHPYTIYSNNESLQQFGIVVNDLNNDSFLDIAVAFCARDNIGILLGYGNGTFSDMKTYSTGIDSCPKYLGLGDFNNDNKTDIAVTNYASDSISIFLGYGDGSFANMMTYSTGQKSNPIGIAIHDLNNDSRLDIVVANSGSNTVAIFFGHGNGSFSIVEFLQTVDNSRPFSVAIADMDNDNQLDIIVVNYDSDSIQILFNSGNGDFKKYLSIPSGLNSNPCWVSVGDFNRDNQLDLAVALHNANTLYILFGSLNINRTSVLSQRYYRGSGSLPVFTCIDDFNQDTYLDIALVNGGTNDIMIFFGLGDGTFLLGKPFSTGSNANPSSMAIGDFNNDSRLDIAASNYASNDIVVFLGDNHEPFGSLTIVNTGSGSHPYSVATGDCNNDGQMDIIVANYGTNNVGVILAGSRRVFQPMITYSTDINSSPSSLALAHLNNDQNLDIVVTNSQSDNIMILFGNGNGSFIDRIIYSMGEQSRPYQIVISDMNNDHLFDFVIVNSRSSNIYILYGLGNGTFGNGSSYSLGYGYEPYGIAVSDLNEDGQMDIVVACYHTDHVEILLRTTC